MCSKKDETQDCWKNMHFKSFPVQTSNCWLNSRFFQFFHEVDECEHWMNTTLSRIHLSFDRSNLQGDRADARDMMKEIKVKGDNY